MKCKWFLANNDHHTRRSGACTKDPYMFLYGDYFCEVMCRVREEY